ncbi:MAG: hypothetical protein ABS917_16480 [Solibacillus sp.]|uniref:hypothetical protein n=1 Tax=Solibacillus sp. TaxID=1909654 RepID=UPI0033145BE2
MAGYKNLVYTNAEELMHRESRFKAYENAIHITATNSLKAGMMTSNSDSSLNRWFSGPIISFAELLRFLGYGWSKSKTNLKQFTLLSKALRESSASISSEERELFAAIDKNQELILRTIRLLSESGYTSTLMRQRLIGAEVKRQEELFLDLWENIEQDQAFQCIHQWFVKLQQSPEIVFRDTLVELFNSLMGDPKKRTAANILPGKSAEKLVSEKLVIRNKCTLVLHGFYFLVPIQKRLFDILSERFDIIHVINYQSNHKHGFQTVERFLNIDGKNFEKVLDSPYSVNYHAKELLLAINGQFIANKFVKNEKNLEKINYLEFHTLQQLRRYTQNYNERYVSPRAIQVADFLTTTEQTNHQKLSEHPLGRFLVNIHRINKRKFNVATGEFIDNENVTHDLLRELFNSGYLYVKGVNAQSAMRTLDMLQEISKTFTTFDDWYDGLAEIIELKQEAESKLKSWHSYKSKNHQMYSFYHEAIGYFYCTKEDLRFVRSAITKIKQFFELLFEGNEIDIKQYIEILEGHIEQEIIPVISDQLDKKIAGNIITALDELKDDSLDKMDRQDLVQGLQYFLAQKPDLEDEYEMELYGQQDQNNLNIINSLLNSDGLQFEDNRVIHFTMMDNEAFPTQQPLNSWPISRDSFNILCDHNNYLNQLKMRKELEVEIACYQFYLIMTNAVKINFSIVRRLNERKDLKRCFYLNFLSLIQGSYKQLNTLLQKQIETNYQTETITFDEQKYEIMPSQMFNRCPKRFVYTFLLDRRPVFHNAFHEPFLFQQLIGYDYGIRKKTQKLALYRDWFPHWSETKKDIYEATAMDYMDKNPYMGTIHFTVVDGWKYRDIRMGLNLFGSRSEGENTKGRQDPLTEKHFVKPGDHCKYCPYQRVCTDSMLYK